MYDLSLLLIKNIFFTCHNIKNLLFALQSTQRGVLDSGLAICDLQTHTTVSKTASTKSKFSITFPKLKKTQPRGNTISFKRNHVSWKLQQNDTRSSARKWKRKDK